MSRTPLIAGNWKMNLDHLEAIQLVQRLVYHLDPDDYETNELVVIPPFTALRSIQTLIDGDRLPLGLGAQDCHWEDAGAYTGEVSPSMVAALRCRYVICGHSERRIHFGEYDETINRKLHAVLGHAMTPILCVGESMEQRDAGDAASVVSTQLEAGMKGMDGQQAGELVVAYEPVWAIGTGRTATPEDANEMCGLIREAVAERYGRDVAATLRVQYGGSVKPGNVKELMAREEIDGALVGGASIDADDFAVLCRYHRL